jgi:hypothetical protein
MEAQRRRFLAKVAKYRHLHFRHFLRLVRFDLSLSFSSQGHEFLVLLFLGDHPALKHSRVQPGALFGITNC